MTGIEHGAKTKRKVQYEAQNHSSLPAKDKIASDDTRLIKASTKTFQ